MRLVKIITDLDRRVPINGTNIVIQFKDGYGEVDDKYLHHFGNEYEILPVEEKIPVKGIIKPQVKEIKEEIPQKETIK